MLLKGNILVTAAKDTVVNTRGYYKLPIITHYNFRILPQHIYMNLRALLKRSQIFFTKNYNIHLAKLQYHCMTV